MSEPRGVPTTAELVAAVRGFLSDEVAPAADDRVRFLVLVANNVLKQVERELELGPAHERAREERLEALGVADESALAAAIRDGTLDDRMDEVVAAVRATTVERLRVLNPRYLQDGER